MGFGITDAGAWHEGRTRRGGARRARKRQCEHPASPVPGVGHADIAGRRAQGGYRDPAALQVLLDASDKNAIEPCGVEKFLFRDKVSARPDSMGWLDLVFEEQGIGAQGTQKRRLELLGQVRQGTRE